MFLDAEKEQSSLEIATIIVETVEGQGYVTISNIGDYSTDGREDGRGKGKNSGRTSSTDEIKFSIVSDVIEKHGGLSELIRKYGSISITVDSSSSHTNKCIKLKNIRS